MKKWILGLCLAVYSLPLPAHALDILLPQVYTNSINVTGWLVSEKLDGVRGYWDGKKLVSKNGIPFQPPALFVQGLPPFALEGEIWGGRQTFAQTMSIIKRHQPHDGWLQLQFAIFDVPRAMGGFSQRLQKAKDWFKHQPSPYAFVIPQKLLQDNKQLEIELQRVEKLGGEGLIVRKADALYQSGRSKDILKVKSFFDMEAVVIGHIEGRGRNRGRLGSMLVELPNKRRFKIGTGFSDAERHNPPPISSIITFKYYGFFKSGLPKFPSFIRIKEGKGLAKEE